MTAFDRRTVLKSGLAAGACLLPAHSLNARSSEQPNFIVIYVDDLGYGDVQPTGGKTIKTPHLSSLARDGVTLTDYYAPANVCTPSRAGFLTGRYPIRTGLARGVIMQNDKRGLPTSELTIAKALKPSYATAMIGKWHLGNPGTASWPPTNHGFDLFYGIPYSHDMSPLSLWECSNGTRREAAVDLPELQQALCSRAERFIDDNNDRPFFLALTLTAPHLPNFPQPSFAGRSKAGAYGDSVEEMDAIVGRIMSKLEHHGLTRRTMVIFTSDNGPWFEGSAGQFRERKGGGAFDGAFRVPFIASQPGFIPRGQRTDSIAMGIDLLPTLTGMAGIKLPQDTVIDGRNISDVLTRGAASPHDHLLLFNDEDIVGLRTQRWKYVDASYYRNFLIPLKGRGYPQLYDSKMPGENYSVASLHPDIVKQLQRALAQEQAKFDGLRTGKSGIPNIPMEGVEVPAQWRD